MNNIDKAFNSVQSIGQFSREYFSYLSTVLDSIDETELNKLEDFFELARYSGSTIFVAGNGGSSADADHFVAELICTFNNKKRPPLSAISLSSNSAAISAWSNDFNFNSFYSRNVDAMGRFNDILFILSTGGGNNKTGTSINIPSKYHVFFRASKFLKKI